MSTKIEIVRFNRDEFQKAAAVLSVIDMIRKHFPEFDETKGDMVELLEEVVVDGDSVISLKQENEFALVWKSHR